jgi:hypothetical protein
MKTITLLAVVSLSLAVAGCTTMGKAPIGKTPAPVVTKY